MLSDSGRAVRFNCRAWFPLPGGILLTLVFISTFYVSTRVIYGFDFFHIAGFIARFIALFLLFSQLFFESKII